jgi:phage baseplate assembly protein W|tara:strand:+ start:144 stop:557 length:414 start_codon:yes stop_codon:yes gene_type:complete
MPIHTKPLSTANRVWTDLDLDFTRHPITGDINKKRSVEAIKRSVRNLLQTNKYERPFNPDLGSGINGLLFELVSPTTANVLDLTIREVIENYEPRVIIQNIRVQGDIDRNGYHITIEFTTINTLQPVIIELFLERLR